VDRLPAAAAHKPAGAGPSGDESGATHTPAPQPRQPTDPDGDAGDATGRSTPAGLLAGSAPARRARGSAEIRLKPASGGLIAMWISGARRLGIVPFPDELGRGLAVVCPTTLGGGRVHHARLEDRGSVGISRGGDRPHRIHVGAAGLVATDCVDLQVRVDNLDEDLIVRLFERIGFQICRSRGTAWRSRPAETGPSWSLPRRSMSGPAMCTFARPPAMQPGGTCCSATSSELTMPHETPGATLSNVWRWCRRHLRVWPG
jgi:hypothetical protein